MNKELVSANKAFEALDNLDDYARMDLGVDAIGPRSVLKRFIEQSEQQRIALEKQIKVNADYVYLISKKHELTEQLSEEIARFRSELTAYPKSAGAFSKAIEHFVSTVNKRYEEENMNDKELDEFHRHELMDRISCVSMMFDSMVVDHLASSILREDIDAVSSALADLYQKAGRRVCFSKTDNSIITAFERDLASTDAYDPQSFIDGAVWAEEKLNDTVQNEDIVHFDLERMKTAMESDTIKVPPGLSREEQIKLICDAGEAYKKSLYRKEVLEEAAKVCDELAEIFKSPIFDIGYVVAARVAASEIRESKENTDE